MTNPRPVFAYNGYYKNIFSDSANILIDSRTVVENKDFVATGILNYAQGDILEIEIAEYNKYTLGEPVKITIYSMGGIHTMVTTVIAKHQGTIMVLNPPENQKKFLGKREHPRVETEKPGLIHSIMPANQQKNVLDHPIQIVVSNISLKGIGFIQKTNPEFCLDHQYQAEVEVDLGFDFMCKIEVKHKKETKHGLYYGAEMIHFPQEIQNSLRAFILKLQVEARYREREQEFKTRFNK